MRRLATSLAALGFWLCATAAPAAALDPEALRRDLIEGLEHGLSVYARQGIEYGQIKTSARGDAVRVEIAGLAMPLPDFGGRAELGDVAFTVAGAGEGQYRVSDVRGPAQITIVADDGSQFALANYRLEHLTGVWSSVLASFLDLDMAVGDVEILVPKGNFAAQLKRLAVRNRYTPGAEGLTDQTSMMRAQGLRALIPLQGTFQIEEILGESEFKGLDMAAYRALAEEMRALDGGASGQGAPPDRAALAKLIERLRDINVFPRRAVERVEVRGIALADPANNPVFRLEEIEIDSTGEDLSGPLAAGSMGMRYGGLRIEEPGPAQALVPTDAGFILSIERVPMRALWQLLLTGMALTVAAPESNPDANALSEAMGSEIMDAMTKAGTRFLLDRLHTESPSGQIDGKGLFEMDATTPVGVKGGLELTITGLDRMITVASQAAGNGAEGQPGAAGGVMFLMILKGMARREAGANGAPVDRFDIRLSPEGQLLVNGQPMGMLSGPQQ